MRRDFTYVDDIVAGVIACLGQAARTPTWYPPCGSIVSATATAKSCRAVRRRIIEEACGRKAIVERVPMPPGDIEATYADIAATTRDFGFVPRTALAEGLPRFVKWYRDYHKV